MHALLLDPGGVLTARPYAFRTAAFRPVEAVGVFLCTTVRIILLSTTIPISGLDHMACVLATPGSVPLLAETHAGSLLTCWLGFRQVGLEPSPVLTHWATTTNFMGLLPLPRFRAYLGATTAGFGQVPRHGSLLRCAPHAYLITLSAWNTSVGGSVSPSASAVFRLITNSKCIGCSMGRSPGLAPRRILST